MTIRFLKSEVVDHFKSFNLMSKTHLLGDFLLAGNNDSGM